VTVLVILAAACLAWGLPAMAVVAFLDGRHRIAHLLDLLHHLGGNRA
jgi:hypothetical protein